MNPDPAFVPDNLFTMSAKPKRKIKSASKVKEAIQKELEGVEGQELVERINELRRVIHEYSPFKTEPVDCVLWVPNGNVTANDYNPNSVAPPEMALLQTSIEQDGYTQPIVAWDKGDEFEVVDGFHRHRVGKECDDIQARVHGYLPLAVINEGRKERGDRIASTIRHNRARGKHKVESMSDIVVELKRRNWSDAKISKNLGMDEDEILRLCQIAGLTEAFADKDFSQAWDAVIMQEEDSFIDEKDVEQLGLDEDRIFHEWEDWECYPAGFYSDKPPKDMTVEECEEAYRDFLADIPRFQKALKKVLSKWKNSCEHYLTNEKMNRIAWLGQASMCIETGISSRFCGGYNLLTDEQKEAADKKAHQYLNKWLKKNGRDTLTWDDAQSKTKANLY